MVVAATGSAEDPREPHYFKDFMTEVEIVALK